MDSSKTVFICLLLFLTGCATTHQKIKTDDMNEYEMRINELEDALRDRDEEILDLTNEVNRLQQSTSRIKTSSVSTSSKLSHKDIQKALKNAGFYNGSIDGKIGKNTKRAIKEFQKANGLTADGIVGKRTIEKLKKYL